MTNQLSALDVRSFDSPQALAAAAAQATGEVIRNIQASSTGGVNADGLARIALTGGGTGNAVSAALAAVKGIDWSRVVVFFGDERWVPSAHAERNERQSREALLNKVEIPAENILGYPIPENADLENPNEADLAAAAAAYAETFAQRAPKGLDIHFLGMGPEGHFNSLFPHTEELLTPVSAVQVVRNCPKPPPTRLTFTLPVVNAASHVWLVVAGEGKAEALGHVVHRDDPAEWPAAGVEGTQSTIAFADTAAASRI